MFDFVFDACFFAGVYLLFYKGVEKVLTEHHGAIKVLFDVNLRINNFSREMDTRARHSILHAITSVFSFLLLGTIPIIQTFLYIAIFQIVDIITLNRVLLYVTILKIARETYNRHDKVPNSFYLDVMQMIYLALNYSNNASAIAAIFQMIDEAFEVDDLIQYYDKIYDNLIGVDTKLRTILWEFRGVLTRREVLLKKIRLVLMGSILVTSFLFSSLHSLVMVLFYYYGALRMVFIYSEEEFSKVN